jgi:Predicted dehydrogenases and related proteins
MKEIKWGIIGCGDVTELKSGPAFNKVPNSSLVAVMRRDAEKARDYALRHNVPRWYNKVEELINDPEVNAIYIATPPLQHEEYTLLSLAARKPVYVEKPMTLNTESALRMEDAAANFNVKLCVAHYRREQPMFLKVKQLLLDKVIGDVRFVQLQMFQSRAHNLIANTGNNWRLDPSVSGGGLFHDLAPHQLDLLIYYFGEVRSSSGISINQSNEYPADDLVTGQILFENGIIFNGMWCFTVSENDKKDVFEITGSAGKISFPVFGNKITLKKDGYEEELVFEPLQHVQQPMIEKVTAYFLDEGDNPCSAAQAIWSMKVMDSFTKKR